MSKIITTRNYLFDAFDGITELDHFDGMYFYSLKDEMPIMIGEKCFQVKDLPEEVQCVKIFNSGKWINVEMITDIHLNELKKKFVDFQSEQNRLRKISESKFCFVKLETTDDSLKDKLFPYPDDMPVQRYHEGHLGTRIHKLTKVDVNERILLSNGVTAIKSNAEFEATLEWKVSASSGFGQTDVKEYLTFLFKERFGSLSFLEGSGLATYNAAVPSESKTWMVIEDDSKNEIKEIDATCVRPAYESWLEKEDIESIWISIREFTSSKNIAELPSNFEYLKDGSWIKAQAKKRSHQHYTFKVKLNYQKSKAAGDIISDVKAYYKGYNKLFDACQLQDVKILSHDIKWS